jgi:pimeloyl-ACP methyl ester carboxylesterase
MAEHIDGPLHWEQLGRSGRPIAFVHPNPMDYSCWLYQMAHLSTWFKTIGIDLPGYGRSPTARPGLTMDDIAQACWEAVDEVTDEPAIVVGCSVGSGVIQYMASQRPQRTLAVVVSGSRWRVRQHNVPRRIAQYQEQGVAFRYQHTFEDYSRAFRQTDYARYFAELFTERNAWADAATIVQMMRARAQPDPDSLFENIKAPMLILTGSEDNSHQAFALQERVSGCELVTIQGAGHACYMERPWEWDAHFLEFLARHGLFEEQPSRSVVSA